MDPVSVSVTIARPREEVFEYLVDVANHPEFCDHYLVDWRLTREDSYGRGAGAHFRVKIPFNRFPWANVVFAEVEPPRLIVETGRTGKFNRIRTLGTYELEPGSGDTTRVTFTFETEPGNLADRLGESLGARGWLRRKTLRAMRRLRSILEEDRNRGKRATVAAG
jgi:uncharacterized protein YndB with AHSA1/START domain